MSEGRKTGISTVLGEARAQEVAVPGDQSGCEQPELFPLSKIEDTAQAREIGFSNRGRGRPPGAKNKNTEAWREFLLSRYPSPLQGLAEISFRSVQDLAAELGYTGNLGRTAEPDELLELLKVQISAMKELAPYLHSKQPQAVDLGENGLISLVINTGGESKQNQGLMEMEILDSNEHKSNGSGEGSENE